MVKYVLYRVLPAAQKSMSGHGYMCHKLPTRTPNVDNPALTLPARRLQASYPDAKG